MLGDPRIVRWSLTEPCPPSPYPSRLQSAPHDLGSPGFHSRIKPRLDAALLAMSDTAGLASGVRAACETRRGAWIRGCDWARWDTDTTVAIAVALGPRVVAAILGAFAEDYWGSAGGMPDLLLWRSGEARWIEVKGPGDALRGSQRAWLSTLAHAGAAVEVVHVAAVSPN